MHFLDYLLSDFQETFQSTREEAAMRETIITSKVYQAMQQAIDFMLEEQKKLLSAVPDSREEHDMDKKALIKYMEEQGLTQAGDFQAKTRTNRKVDVYAVLKALEGDLDALMVIVSITQKSLEEFAKDNDRKDLKQCIKETGTTITDLYLPA